MVDRSGLSALPYSDDIPNQSTYSLQFFPASIVNLAPTA